jgi:hypothetical protein
MGYTAFAKRVTTMDQTVAALSEKIQTLSSEQLAEVEEFIESLQGHGYSRSFASLSEPAFAAVWNNPEDDAYDAL